MSDYLTDTLQGIELTDEGKKEMKEIEFVQDDERAQMLDDPVRLSILKILRKGKEDSITTEEYNEDTKERITREKKVQRHALSVVEIVNLAEELEGVEEITKNKVYHHLPKLIDAGYVVEYGKVETGKRTTHYYRRTAKGFVVSLDSMQKKSQMVKDIEENIERLERVFGIIIPEDKHKELVELEIKISELYWENRRPIIKMVKSDVADEEALKLYDWLVRLRASGSPEYKEYQDKIREIIFG
ncbi:MAG: hypothetical protein BAJATHORv1_20063 [Candidatus Thorarchaeota archaeon]|nr:MAG: hypothetical protein BAJATHORv1_20063 [Candidatus Thorarchaeota archaeon]